MNLGKVAILEWRESLQVQIWIMTWHLLPLSVTPRKGSSSSLQDERALNCLPYEECTKVNCLNTFQSAT